MDLGFKIQKINLGIRIRIMKIPSVSIFRQNGQIWLFWPKFGQKWVVSSKLRKQMLEKESASLRYHVYQFLDKTANFEYLGPNLPKTGYWGRNSKNLNLDSNQHPWGIICTNFQTKWTTLNFWAQMYPKIDFGVGISKI